MKIRWLIITVSIVIVGGLAFLLKDFLRDNLYVPIIDMVRFVSVLFRSLPQAFWWWLVLFILALYAAWIFMTRRKSVPSSSQSGARNLSRAMVWIQWIERSHRGDYSRWLLSRQIAQLALQIIAHQEKQPVEWAKEEIISSRFQLPAGVEDFIKTGITTPTFPQYTDLIRRKGRKKGREPLELKVDEVVQFLENSMK